MDDKLTGYKKYQYKIKEITCDLTYFADYDSNDVALFPPNSISDIEQEMVEALDARALARLSKLAVVAFTGQQRRVWRGMVDGLTQSEIAEKMGVVQSAVSIYLNGLPGKTKPIRGGMKQKIAKVCIDDNIFRAIIAEEYEIGQGVFLHLASSWFDPIEKFFGWLREENT